MEATPEQIRTATLAKVRRAKACIQEAQNQLGTACAELSALMSAAPEWKKCSKLYDNVHAFWYVVEALEHKRGVTLDQMNVDALAKSLAAEQARTLPARNELERASGRRADEVEGMGGDAVLDRSAP